MKVFTPLLFLVASAHAASLSVSAGLNPVARIVMLLEGLKKKMMQDKEADQSAFEKYECWCETMKKAKTASIAESNASIEKLNQEKKDADVDDLVPSEKAGHEKAIAEFNNKLENLRNQQSQNDATKSAKIQELEGLIEALTGKNGAVPTLEAAQPGSGSFMAISAVVSSSTSQMEQAQTIADLMSQQAPDAKRRNSKNTQVQDYGSQTGDLIGQLKKMSADMQTEKENTEDELEKDNATFTSLIEETTGLLEDEQEAMGEAKHLTAARAKKHAECDAEIQRLNDCITADQEMLDVTDFNCAEETKRFNHRIEIRDMEITSFAQAISILASDEARDTFNSSFDSNFFLQMAMAPGCSAAKRIHKAALALAETGAYRLSAMLKHRQDPVFKGDENIKDILGPDNFQKIMDAIDNSITALKDRTKEDETELSELSETNTQANERLMQESKAADAAGEKRQNNMAVAKEELAKEVAAIQAQNQISHEMALARQARADERAEAQNALEDDQQAVTLIGNAIQVLEDNAAAMAEKNQQFGENDVQQLKEYGAGDTGFIQAPKVEAGEKLPPPPETAHYDEGSHDGEGKGVVAVLDMIKKDIEKDIETSADDQEKEEEMFEKAMGDLTKSQNAEIALEQAAHNKRDSAMEKATEAHEASQTAKTNAAKEIGDIRAMHERLTWMGTNVATRKANAEKEIGALQSAKTLLGGGASFLQRDC